MPPEVAPLLPGDLLAGAPHDERMLEFGRLGGRCVGGLLHRHDLAAPVEAVGGDEDLRAAILQARGDRVGAVAGEDRDEDRAELAAGQRRRDDLRDHRHEDADAIALADAEAGERVGGLVGEGEQLGVGVAPDLAVLALPDQRRLRRVGSAGVLVERGGDVVELAATVPGRPRDAARGIHHLRVGTLPDQPQVVGDGVPEPGGIGVGAREQIGIAGDAVPLHEAAQPAALEVFLAGPPGDWLVQALPVLRVAGYGCLAHCYCPLWHDGRAAARPSAEQHRAKEAKTLCSSHGRFLAITGGGRPSASAIFLAASNAG